MIKQPWLRTLRLMTVILSVISLSGCVQNAQKNSDNTTVSQAGYRQFNVLAVNDIYNVEGIDARKSGGMARLRTLRKQFSDHDQQVLLLHAGDFLFPSSMSTQYRGEQMIDLMNGLNGEEEGFDERFYVVFGNHEFDKKAMKYADMLAQRIEESDFYWLGTNITFDQAAVRDSEGYRKSLVNNAIIDINGVKVGLYGVTTDIAIPEYATIDNDFVAISRRNITQLKAKGAEVIISVSHLSIFEDKELIEQLGEDGPDVVFGGHEHARQHVCVGKRCVIKADADLRSATVAVISVSPTGEVQINHRYSILNDTTIAVDPIVEKRTNHWIERYQHEYCLANQQSEGCLLQVIGKTDVQLVAEELEIRRFETNLGSYVADQMVKTFDNIALPDDQKVQIGLVNSGSLRLNQNIPAGTELNEWYLNGIFQYPVDLRLIEISGKTLQAAIEHSIEKWSGNGWWLQTSGIAFRHDTKNQRVTDLSLVDRKGNITRVKDDDKILAVVNSYIADPSIANQDGYTMLNLDNEVVYADELISLKSAVIEAIKTQWKDDKAISPVLPGRVCNSQRPYLPCILDKK